MKQYLLFCVVVIVIYIQKRKMDKCEDATCSIWDSSHDWILQFDNILKARSNHNQFSQNIIMKERNEHRLKECHDSYNKKYKSKCSFQYLIVSIL